MDSFDFDKLPPEFDEVIEAEMERLLAAEHGLAGVRVCVDRKIARITCSRDVPEEVQGQAFAKAVKHAIVRRVRELDARHREEEGR